ncbi:hypothetical protein IE53DRAFT_389099 [Violaceomyces palustris]|uniref:Uncharacterized protein n=1 Tax=Violaceomyces palustris TaxID=1673888 RepID=A0ACD0NSC6_9BASI|nr:hypothetical protein IE53DRAFT_389099 [Violaceomyces palustris]
MDNHQESSQQSAQELLDKRRAQNKLAQRRFREKAKAARKAAAEAAAAAATAASSSSSTSSSSASSSSPQQPPSSSTISTAPNVTSTDASPLLVSPGSATSAGPGFISSSDIHPASTAAIVQSILAATAGSSSFPVGSPLPAQIAQMLASIPPGQNLGFQDFVKSQFASAATSVSGSQTSNLLGSLASQPEFQATTLPATFPTSVPASTLQLPFASLGSTVATPMASTNSMWGAPPSAFDLDLIDTEMNFVPKGPSTMFASAGHGNPLHPDQSLNGGPSPISPPFPNGSPSSNQGQNDAFLNASSSSNGWANSPAAHPSPEQQQLVSNSPQDVSFSAFEEFLKLQGTNYTLPSVASISPPGGAAPSPNHISLSPAASAFLASSISPSGSTPAPSPSACYMPTTYPTPTWTTINLSNVPENRMQWHNVVTPDPKWDQFMMPRTSFGRALILNAERLGLKKAMMEDCWSVSYVAESWKLYQDELAAGRNPQWRGISRNSTSSSFSSSSSSNQEGHPAGSDDYEDRFCEVLEEGFGASYDPQPVDTSRSPLNDGRSEGPGKKRKRRGTKDETLPGQFGPERPVDSQMVGSADRRLNWDKVPKNMHPTKMQLTKEHHPYLDIAFPWPSMREKILTFMNSVFDEDEFCEDMYVAGMSTENEPAFLIWGDDTMDENAWEVGEEFAKKWWILLDNDILRRTNWWRRQRGLKNLERPGQLGQAAKSST